MRSVVFVVYSMNVGGVEKAFLGVIKNFIKNGWEVHVALLRFEGDFLGSIPENVIIHKVEGFDEVKKVLHTPPKQIILEYLRNLKFLAAIRHLWYYANIKFTGTALKLYKHEFKKIPYLNNSFFDLAVAFAGPDAFIDHYVSTRIYAREKWGWIHFDISKFGIDKGIMINSGSCYKQINIVSQDGKQIFDATFPQLKEKSKFVPNIIDNESIIKLAKENINLPDTLDAKIILTVGRVSPEKGQFMALQAIKLLIDKGYSGFKWWIVGTGTDIDRCKEFVIENGLQNIVYFYGVQVNPYPYYSKCDLYLQPSMHEGFCITLGEAKIFEKQILCTNFTGSYEQLSNYKSPYKIVRASEVNIAEGLEWFLNQ